MKTDLREWLWESANIEPDVDVEKDDDLIDRSLEAFEYLRTFDELNPERIRKAHGKLMNRRQPTIAGKYREKPVYIGGEKKDNQEVVRSEVNSLCKWHPKRTVETLEWHVKFERVHPFNDGNGRIGRILYLWHCDNIGVEPIMFRAEDKKGYYALFA